MKLEAEVNVAEEAVDKISQQDRLRKEAILVLFADRKIPAGQAARELGLERLGFMALAVIAVTPLPAQHPLEARAGL